MQSNPRILNFGAKRRVRERESNKDGVLDCFKINKNLGFLIIILLLEL